MSRLMHAPSSADRPSVRVWNLDRDSETLQYQCPDARGPRVTIRPACCDVIFRGAYIHRQLLFSVVLYLFGGHRQSGAAFARSTAAACLFAMSWRVVSLSLALAAVVSSHGPTRRCGTVLPDEETMRRGMRSNPDCTFTSNDPKAVYGPE